MTLEETTQKLREYNAWRKYGNTPDGPDSMSWQEITDTIDRAIELLSSINNKPNKEYYGG